MKLTITTILLLIASLTSYAQTQEEVDALSEFLNPENLAYLQEHNEIRLKQMAVLNKAYHLSEYGAKNIDEVPTITLVTKKYDILPEITPELIANGDLNLLGYDFELFTSKYSYYKIGNGNQVLVIPPTDLSLKRANLETY